MKYYDDLTGVSPRSDDSWVRVLPMPNRYPQDMEWLEIQEVVTSRFVVHTSAYEVIGGIRATISSGGDYLSLSQGTLWSGIGGGLYVQVPIAKIPIPRNITGPLSLGIELVKEVRGSGYDPILGSIPPLLWEAPHDRLSIYVRYVWDTPDTLPVLTLREGKIYYYSDRPNPLRDTLIKTYMRELDGDYIAWGMDIIYEPPTSQSGAWVHVGAGRAWIGGTPVETQAQSIPYRDGVLQLCTDGTIAIESSYANYVPEYSTIVSSEGIPILMGRKYGVVLPTISTNPYLIPIRCIPLAYLLGGAVDDVAPRLPTHEEILLLLSRPEFIRASNQVGDIDHPLYKARVTNQLPDGSQVGSGVIYLPRLIASIPLPGYEPPNTAALLEESTVRTDWIDSSPTPSTPPPPPPFIHVGNIDREGQGVVVRGYNLTPGGTYTPNPAPSRVVRGTQVGLSITADPHGMLEYVSSQKPIDLSGIAPTDMPNLSIGLGQSFRVLTPVMVGSVSLYLRAGYYGVISICALQGTNQPQGPALAWVGVSRTSTGWVDIEIGPVFLQVGTYALISQSIVGSVMGRRHYLLPTLAGTPETTGSMNMLLSQDGLWQSLPNMDLMYRINRAIPTSTYRDRVTTIEWSEPFDGYEYTSAYHLPPGTYITCTALTKEGGVLLGKTFPPRTSMVLSEALFGTPTLFPTIGDANVQLYTTSKTGTWISREELVGSYTGVSVALNAHIPEGSSVTVYVAGANGWLPLVLSGVTGSSHVYQVEGLSPTTSSTDINGAVRQVIRERVRIRIELSTLSPELQPYVWGVVTTTTS